MIKITEVTISSLIFRSPEYACFLMKGLEKHTPARYSFYFVANDPTDEMAKWLSENDVPHYIFRNKDPKEWYLKRVYRAWNYAVEMCKTKVIVLINSDMFPSPGWLEGLLKYLTPKTVVTSTLVEPGHTFPVFRGMFKGAFGTSPSTFDEKGFLAFARKITYPGVRKNPGPYQPLAIYKDVFLKVGGYPEGNVGNISGDTICFRKLESMDVENLVSMESVVYHIKEGEGRS